MRSRIPFYTVDAFTDRPFSGNPAAVCTLLSPLPRDAMQRVAAEMNLSETAFVEPPDDEGVRTLRWFTPTVEVPLCGHATLAASHVLLDEIGDADPPLRYATASGRLTVHREGGGLRMDFPSDPPAVEAPPPALLGALGCPEGVPTLRAAKLWIVHVGSEGEVRDLEPDMSALVRVEIGNRALGVAVTARSASGDDFVSRFFAPWVGVDEDPVTGVAHTALGPFWADELGRAELAARQLSKRGGRVGIRMEDDRVHLVGRAVTVAEGRIRTS